MRHTRKVLKVPEYLEPEKSKSCFMAENNHSVKSDAGGETLKWNFVRKMFVREFS